MSLEPPIIVGTGPSGVAVAAALIDAGMRPVMLDGGNTPDEVALAHKSRSANSASEDVAKEDVDFQAGDVRKGDPGRKSWFGSSSPFAQPADSVIDYQPDLIARASYGVGGLSRVWGGTFDFYRSFAGWPATAKPEQRDIDFVRRLVPSSITTWPGAGAVVLPGEVQGSWASRRAMRGFMRRCNPESWEVVPSSVAIDTRDGSNVRCNPCGLCLTGCPLDSIWFAGDQIKRWAAAGRIDHRPDHVVRRVEERDDRVILTASRDGTTTTFTSGRVYIAAGALSTAALLVASALVGEVTVRDTATSFGAALDPRRAPKSTSAHGLSQWWARSRDESFSAQIYPPSSANAALLADRLPLSHPSSATVSKLAMRLHPVISYLDSSLSDSLTVDRRGGRVRVAGALSDDTVSAFRFRLRRLSRSLSRSGYLMPVKATQITAPGTGFHSGASLRHGFEADDLGRPFGLSRVHIVDSSVLTTLEVGSITPTVMANAVRIGRNAATLDGRT